MRLALMLVGLAAWAAGCGGERENVALAHDIGTLAGGVDPRREAEAVAVGLERTGWTIGRRVEAPNMIAFDAVHDEDGRTAIRIITKRGIAAALEVPFGEREQPISIRPTRGIDDLVVARADPAHDRECLVLFRVREDGAVFQVPFELGRFGREACVEEARDVGRDERPELLTRLRLYALSRGETPSIRAVLEVRGEGYSPAPPSAYRRFWAEEEQRVRDALTEARGALDVEAAYRATVELAALVRERGGTGPRQLAAFDEGLGGLVLTEAQAQGVAFARAHIADGWPE